MSSSYLITCSANPIDPSEHSKNNLNLHIIFTGLSKPLTILFLFLLTDFFVRFHNPFSLSLPILYQNDPGLSSFFCAVCKIIWIFFQPVTLFYFGRLCMTTMRTIDSFIGYTKLKWLNEWSYCITPPVITTSTSEMINHLYCILVVKNHREFFST